MQKNSIYFVGGEIKSGEKLLKNVEYPAAGTGLWSWRSTLRKGRSWEKSETSMGMSSTRFMPLMTEWFIPIGRH